jgi:membrane protease YdiL (CAAX protease family)
MKVWRRSWIILWKSAAFLALWAILLAPFIVPLAGRLEKLEHLHPLRARLYFDVLSSLTALCAAGVMARLADRRGLLTVGLAPRHLARDLLLGAGGGSAWLAATLAILWAGGWLSPMRHDAAPWVAVAGAGSAMAFNTLAQEAVSRGYLFQTIQSQAGPVWAIVLTSLLFSAAHAGAFGGSLLPALNVFCAGALFGVAFWMTGTLWLPIGIHFAWNFLLGPVLGLTVSGQSGLALGESAFAVRGPDPITGGRFGVEGSVITTATTAAGITALLLLHRRRRATPGAHPSPGGKMESLS